MDTANDAGTTHNGISSNGITDVSAGGRNIGTNRDDGNNQPMDTAIDAGITRNDINSDGSTDVSTGGRNIGTNRDDGDGDNGGGGGGGAPPPPASPAPNADDSLHAQGRLQRVQWRGRSLVCGGPGRRIVQRVRPRVVFTGNCSGIAAEATATAGRTSASTICGLPDGLHRLRV